MIGAIIGENRKELRAILDVEKIPMKWDYVYYTAKEVVEGREIDAKVVCQIVRISAKDLAFDDVFLGFRDLFRIKSESYFIEASLRVLGYSYKGKIRQPRRIPLPGTPIFLAKDEDLEEFFSFKNGLYIGNLISRENAKIKIDINGFRRHVAILAQTGAGKSYLAGVILEELYKKHANVLVIDPNGDYVNFKYGNNGKIWVDEERVDVYKPKFRCDSESKPLGIRFKDLDKYTLAEILKIRAEDHVNIFMAMNEALLVANESYTDFYLYVKERAVNTGDKEKKKSFLKLLSRLEANSLDKIINDKEFIDISEIFEPGKISILDLSGLNDNLARGIVFVVLKKIFKIKEVEKTNKPPIFIFIDEAHRFIPSNFNTRTTEIIKRIASEGRKFGVFLTIISQRPSKINSDVLSQCNSQVVMRMTNQADISAVSNSSERLSQELLEDLPSLEVGEAIIVGNLVKAPVMVKIRKRVSMEGGSDIDVVKEIEKFKKKKEELNLKALNS